MNPERWRRIEQIYHAVLERRPEDREKFLDQACAGDENLRKEVETLLACDGRAEHFIEQPAMEVAAQVMAGIGVRANRDLHGNRRDFGVGGLHEPGAG